MHLHIPRNKNGMIQEVVIRQVLMGLKGQKIRVHGIDERGHAIITIHVLRKLYLSIYIAYVQELLCPVIRFRILAKMHVLKKLMYTKSLMLASALKTTFYSPRR